MPLDRRDFLQLSALAAAGAAAVAAAESDVVGGEAGATLAPGERRRARALGMRIGRMEPGEHNAITDVPGVEVGHCTVVRGAGALVPGVGPVRTGVTIVRAARDLGEVVLPCGAAIPNGNGELTGLAQIARLGVLETPIALTGTSSVGRVFDALITRLPMPEAGLPPWCPVVGETWDGELSDVVGRHVGAAEVAAALADLHAGAVAEGAVGGGTGMVCYGFKGGIGTASRRLPAPLARYAVGALVQANHGVKELLRIDGVAVGRALADRERAQSHLADSEGAGSAHANRERAEASGANHERPHSSLAADERAPASLLASEGVAAAASRRGGAMRSILMILATDAPLLDFELDRLARRAVHGLARTGSISSSSSGDFALAFSTGNRISRRDLHRSRDVALATVDQAAIQPLFEAAAEAIEEAILDALCMATTTTGRDGVTVEALPLAPTLALLARAGRLAPAVRGAP